jgi:hypothetical protein
VRPGQPYPATFLPASFPTSHQWTAGESNPDLLVAGQVSCRWTSSPFCSNLNQGPPENRTRSRSLQESHAASALADHSVHQSVESSQVVPEGVEPPFPLCKRGVVAIGPRDVARVSLRVARVGFEPTDIGLRAPPEGWSRSLCQFAYRAIRAPSNASFRVALRPFAGPGVEPRHPSL